MKKCNACQNIKSLDEFVADSTKSDMKNPACKSCVKERSKAYRKKYPERLKNKWYKEQYGISLDIFESKIEEQGNSCEICKKEFNNTIIPCLDHNHKNGMIRGLLCKKCNSGIAFFNEDNEILLSAIGYLSKWENTDRIIEPGIDK